MLQRRQIMLRSIKRRRRFGMAEPLISGLTRRVETREKSP
jgi:hypothetical protein